MQRRTSQARSRAATRQRPRRARRAASLVSTAQRRFPTPLWSEGACLALSSEAACAGPCRLTRRRLSAHPLGAPTRRTHSAHPLGPPTRSAHPLGPPTRSAHPLGKPTRPTHAVTANLPPATTGSGRPCRSMRPNPSRPQPPRRQAQRSIGGCREVGLAALRGPMSSSAPPNRSCSNSSADDHSGSKGSSRPAAQFGNAASPPLPGVLPCERRGYRLAGRMLALR